MHWDSTLLNILQVNNAQACEMVAIIIAGLEHELSSILLLDSVLTSSAVCAGVVWIMKFSRNGRYLATAGQDMAIRIWEVILNRSDLNPSGSVQNDGYVPPDQGESSYFFLPIAANLQDTLQS